MRDQIQGVMCALRRGQGTGRHCESPQVPWEGQLDTKMLCAQQNPWHRAEVAGLWWAGLGQGCVASRQAE